MNLFEVMGKFCQSCEKSLSTDQRGQFIQHVNTSKRKNIETKNINLNKIFFLLHMHLVSKFFH